MHTPRVEFLIMMIMTSDNKTRLGINEICYQEMLYNVYLICTITILCQGTEMFMFYKYGLITK